MEAAARSSQPLVATSLLCRPRAPACTILGFGNEPLGPQSDPPTSVPTCRVWDPATVDVIGPGQATATFEQTSNPRETTTHER